MAVTLLERKLTRNENTGELYSLDHVGQARHDTA